MSVFDSLFQGSPPGAATTATATQQSLPDWYTSLIRDMMGRGMQVAAQPYQQYDGARVAGFSPLQQMAFSAAPGLLSGHQPLINDAQNTISGLLPQFDATSAQATHLANTGVGAANTAGNVANNMASRFGGGALDALGRTTNATEAAGLGGAGAVSAAGQAGQGALGAVSQYGVQGANAAMDAATAANAALPGSAPTWTGSGVANAYMSPYTSTVVDEIGRLGNRNFTENIMPSVNAAFISGGQFGSQANADILGRAMRDAQADISGRQASALESGYRTAGDLFNADANRFLQLGQNRANVALQGGQLASGALGQLANLGANTALGAGQLGANTYLGAGQLGANTNMNAAQLGVNANLGAGQLGANTALQAGGLSAGQLGQAAGLQGQLAGQRGQLGLGSAGALGQLASLQQSLGLGGVSALSNLGSMQQQNQQLGLDTAYMDFLRAQGYDMGQLGQLKNLISGIQLPAGAMTASNAPVGGYGASPMSWLAALINGMPRGG